MGTITKFVSGDPRTLGKYVMYSKKCAGEPILLENVLDFSTTGPGSVVAGDVVNALKIPANTVVLKVGAYIITGEGATCTATVGDTAAANGWDASANLETTGGSNISIEGTDTYGLGKLYTADTMISLTMGHDTDAAKVLVWALICPLGTDVA